jgi:hypothetical protein
VADFCSPITDRRSHELVVVRDLSMRITFGSAGRADVDGGIGELGDLVDEAVLGVVGDVVGGE